MFEVSQDHGLVQTEESSDEDPILFEGITVESFELFLSVLYDK